MHIETGNLAPIHCLTSHTLCLSHSWTTQVGMGKICTGFAHHQLMQATLSTKSAINHPQGEVLSLLDHNNHSDLKQNYDIFVLTKERETLILFFFS